MTSVEQQERNRLGDELYERYVKPVESEHPGQYVAIFPDGRRVFAETVHEVVDKALEEFGPGGFVFKVGERVVYHLR
ncbi:MAG: hypothetical protein GEU73_03705 [Chloroflexi bacterium]|nr:hypothetical protein [Chloroflexota bacterium]